MREVKICDEIEGVQRQSENRKSRAVRIKVLFFG